MPYFLYFNGFTTRVYEFTTSVRVYYECTSLPRVYEFTGAELKESKKRQTPANRDAPGFSPVAYPPVFTVYLLRTASCPRVPAP